MTAVTVVSAKGEYTVNSDTEATLASAKDKPIVSPWTEGSLVLEISFILHCQPSA